jgi:WD40 repeat protein
MNMVRTPVRFLIATAIIGSTAMIARPADQRRPVQPRGRVQTIAFTPNGKNVITSDDASTWIWDADTGALVRELPCKQGRAITSITVSPDGRKILTTLNRVGPNDDQYGMVMWDIGGAEIRRFLGHKGTVTSVAFTSDGRTAVSASCDHTIGAWDVESGRRVRTLAGHEGDINQIAVTPDGRTVVSASGDYWKGELHDPSVRVWELSSGKLIKTIPNGKTAVDHMTLSADGKVLAYGGSSSYDKTVHILETERWTEVRRWNLAKHLSAMALSPDGAVLLAGCGDGGVHGKGDLLQLWDVRTGQRVENRFPEMSPPLAVSFSRDGKQAASGHGYFDLPRPPKRDLFGEMPVVLYDGLARLWDVADRKEVRLLAGPDKGAAP